ncbi:MAG: hypothetical protein JWO13_2068 [Acidobacteriales bacterium]|nr:hypothetical protein [Terriglobales bacterium]
MGFARRNFSFLLVTLALALSSNSLAQNSRSTPAPPAVDLQGTLAKVDQTAQAAALDIAKLRIDKWKADANDKRQAQSNADSLERNMTTALPALTSGVRSAPQDFSANFKLYRNLNALYDVFKTLAESAGAFGSKQEFESLAPYAEYFDQHRRSLADYMENLASSKDAELNRLRSQARTAQAAPITPKKVIIDDDQPAPKKKATKKKPPAPTTPQ